MDVIHDDKPIEPETASPLMRLLGGLTKAEDEIYTAHCKYLNNIGKEHHFEDLFAIATEAIRRYKRAVIRKKYT